MQELNEKEKRLIFESMMGELSMDEVFNAFPTMFDKFYHYYYSTNDINIVLPNDIIVFILSLTQLSDTITVSLVCKQWNAALRFPQFWTKRIKQKASTYIIPQKIRDMMQTLDFFIGDMEHMTLKNRLDFLFNSKFHITYGSNWIEILNREGTFRQSFEKDLVQHEQITIVNGNVKRNGLIKSYVLDNSFPLKYYSFNHHELEKEKVDKYAFCIFIYENGVSFQGNSKLTIDWESLKPHGKGTWTFIDGTTLSGEYVAQYGFPHGGSYFMGIRFENEDEEKFLQHRYFKSCNISK